MPGGLTRGSQAQMLSNMKKLHDATSQMELEQATAGDTNTAWPGDVGGSFAVWASNLATRGYLSTNDICKLLTAAGRLTPPGHVPLTNDNAVLVYAAKSSSASNTVFLSSANFTNSPEGGLPITTNARPFGQKGFVIFHRGGDGIILANHHTNLTRLIGSYVPLCK